jgi:hypothetical protein
MHRYSLNSVEMLELKLSPTALSVSGIVASPAVSILRAAQFDHPDDDPLPDPEPPPPPYPGDDPPIGYPALPPSGPIGPGSK